MIINTLGEKILIDVSVFGIMSYDASDSTESTTEVTIEIEEEE